MTKNYVSRSVSADAANRDPDDFYPTPAVATRALLAVEKFRGPIWEPACGDGAISRELEAAGHAVISTDRNDHGYGTIGLDFLRDGSEVLLKQAGLKFSNVVTNPPYKLAESFVHKAILVTPKKVVMLNRLSWLEGRGRYERVYNGATPLARVWVFSSRLHFHRSGDASKAGSGGMVAFAWYVWERGHVGPTELRHLPPCS